MDFVGCSTDIAPPLCNKLHPVGLLPHCILFLSSSRQGIGANKEFNTTQHFLIGGSRSEIVSYVTQYRQISSIVQQAPSSRPSSSLFPLYIIFKAGHWGEQGIQHNTTLFSLGAGLSMGWHTWYPGLSRVYPFLCYI